MRGKIFIVSALVLFALAVWMRNNATLHVIGASFLMAGMFTAFNGSSGVDYTESHYRIYSPILFWKTGEWKSIGGVKRIYIRPMAGKKEMEYRLYFVRRSGNYKIFSSNSLKEAREKAGELGLKYNLPVEEKTTAERSVS